MEKRRQGKAQRNSCTLCVVTRGSLLTWSCLATSSVLRPRAAGRQVQAEIQTEDLEDDRAAILSCAWGQGIVVKDSGSNCSCIPTTGLSRRRRRFHERPLSIFGVTPVTIIAHHILSHSKNTAKYRGKLGWVAVFGLWLRLPFLLGLIFRGRIALSSFELRGLLSFRQFLFRPFLEHSCKFYILQILALLLPGLGEFGAEFSLMYRGFVGYDVVNGKYLPSKNEKNLPICSVNMSHLNLGRYFIVQTSSRNLVPFLPPIGVAFSMAATDRAIFLSLNSTHPSVK